MSVGWDRAEVEAIVRDYFDMLMRELLGRQVNTSVHRREIGRALHGRSEGAINEKAPVLRPGPFNLNLATTYSPTRSHEQYHWRGRS